MKAKDLDSLFVEELKDTYDAQHQLIDALTEMGEVAGSPQVKKVLSERRKSTERQVRRLEQVFRALGQEPERKPSEGIRAALEEGREFLEAEEDQATIDAALITAAQKVEHYEIAAYGTLRTFALTLGRRDEANLLQETIDEVQAAEEPGSTSGSVPIAPSAIGDIGAATSRITALLTSLGIRSIAERAHRLTDDPLDNLTMAEIEALRQGGVDPTTAEGRSDQVARGSHLYASLVATSFTPEVAAHRLGVTLNYVRRLIRTRRLLAVQAHGIFRIPEFQFVASPSSRGRGTHHIVPGLGSILAATPPGLHLVPFYLWFISDHPDLAVGGLHGEPALLLSPREWLARGRPEEPVARLAQALGLSM
jgi:ferritin-like metal-binding protein YciE